jgi:hypothetical protein
MLMNLANPSPTSKYYDFDTFVIECDQERRWRLWFTEPIEYGHINQGNLSIISEYKVFNFTIVRFKIVPWLKEIRGSNQRTFGLVKGQHTFLLVLFL